MVSVQSHMNSEVSAQNDFAVFPLRCSYYDSILDEQHSISMASPMGRLLGFYSQNKMILGEQGGKCTKMLCCFSTIMLLL